MGFIGCAHTNPKYPDRTAAADMATYGIDTITALGFRTAKIYITPNYATDYPGQNFGAVPVNATQLAQTAPMAAILGDVDLDRIVITTYTFANSVNSPFNTLSPTNLSNEYTEIYNLVTHLRATYSNKTFILQNAEGDWELLGNTIPSSEVDPIRSSRAAAFYRTRRQAVNDACAATSGSSPVYLAVEANRVLDDYGDRLHRDAMRLIKPDFVFFTIYESINTWGSQEFTEGKIEEYLRRTAAKVRREIGDVPMVASEFNWPQDEAQFTVHSLDVPRLIDKVIAVTNDLGFKGCIWWQLFDNEEQSPGVPRGFGVYSRNGIATTPGPLTAAGVYLDTLV